MSALSGKTVRFLYNHGFKSTVKRILQKLKLYPEASENAGQSLTSSEIINSRFAAQMPLQVYTGPYNRRRINMVTDSINSGALFGGVATAIILSVLLSKKWGCDLRIITRTDRAFKDNFRKILEANKLTFDRNVEFHFMHTGDRRAELDIGEKDYFITTSWWTTSSVVKSIPEDRIIYLLQEDERMFYPYGDDHFKCSEMLSNNKIKYVVNSELLYDHFVSSGLDNMKENAQWFTPSFSKSSFYYNEKERGGLEKKRFIFYSRPLNFRNMYYLGLEVIEEAVSMGFFDSDEWEIIFLGSKQNKKVTIGGVQPIQLNNLPWDEYCRIIRTTDVGLSLMYTPHPSYPPIDLAASGAVAVTNRFANKQDLSSFSKNILCKDLTVKDLVKGIEQAIGLCEDDKSRMDNYNNDSILRDWNQSFESILDRLGR